MSRWVHRLTVLDSTTGSASCANCGPVVAKWRPSKGFRCPVGYRESKGGRKSTRTRHLATLPERLACGICATSLTRSEAFVDHDHRHCNGPNYCLKCIRGILCRTCNVGLGFFRDDPQLLQAAISYLS